LHFSNHQVFNTIFRPNTTLVKGGSQRGESMAYVDISYESTFPSRHVMVVDRAGLLIMKYGAHPKDGCHQLALQIGGKGIAILVIHPHIVNRCPHDSKANLSPFISKMDPILSEGGGGTSYLPYQV